MLQIYCSWVWRKRTASMLWINGDIERTWIVSLRYAGRSCIVCRIHSGCLQICRTWKRPSLWSPKFQTSQWFRIRTKILFCWVSYLGHILTALFLTTHSRWKWKCSKCASEVYRRTKMQPSKLKMGSLPWWFSNETESPIVRLHLQVPTVRCGCTFHIFQWIGKPKSTGFACPCTAAFLWSTHHQYHGSSDGVTVGVVGTKGL